MKTQRCEVMGVRKVTMENYLCLPRSTPRTKWSNALCSTTIHSNELDQSRRIQQLTYHNSRAHCKGKWHLQLIRRSFKSQCRTLQWRSHLDKCTIICLPSKLQTTSTTKRVLWTKPRSQDRCAVITPITISLMHFPTRTKSDLDAISNKL